MQKKNMDWWTDFFSPPWDDFQRELKRFDTTEDIEFICSTLEVKAGTRILDMPCGDGRLSLSLAEKGAMVTGIDVQPTLIAQAVEKAEEADLVIDFQIGDMRKFSRTEAFDHVICYWGSFGYFPHKENFEVLKNIKTSIVSGGCFLIDTFCLEEVYKNFKPRDWRVSGSIKLLEERILDRVDGSITNKWTYIISSGETLVRESRIQLYSIAELSRMLREIGFHDIKILNKNDGYKGPRTCLLAH